MGWGWWEDPLSHDPRGGIRRIRVVIFVIMSAALGFRFCTGLRL
jgi:hypothetical protein